MILATTTWPEAAVTISLFILIGVCVVAYLGVFDKD
jgi:hypothetical protein